jgi:hypothetical protein
MSTVQGLCVQTTGMRNGNTNAGLPGIFTVRVFPLIGKFYKRFVPEASNIGCRLPVFRVFVPVFLIKGIERRARIVRVAIGTGLMVFLYAADFHDAFGFADIALSVVIPRFTAAACSYRTARFATGSAAADFEDRHRRDHPPWRITAAGYTPQPL